MGPNEGYSGSSSAHISLLRGLIAAAAINRSTAAAAAVATIVADASKIINIAIIALNNIIVVYAVHNSVISTQYEIRRRFVKFIILIITFIIAFIASSFVFVFIRLVVFYFNMRNARDSRHYLFRCMRSRNSVITIISIIFRFYE